MNKNALKRQSPSNIDAFQYAAENDDDDEGSFAVDDDEEWDADKNNSPIEYKNSKFEEYAKRKMGDDEIQTLITELLGKEKDSSTEDVIYFPESDEDDDNYDSDARHSSDEEDEEDDQDEDRDEEGQDRDGGGGEDRGGGEMDSESGESETSQEENFPNDNGRDETMTILSAAGGRADLRTVVDEFHQEPEETAAGYRFNTPQNPKASFLSACSSNSSSSSEEFFSPGKKRDAAETAAEADKDEYLLVDTLICNADNCQSGRVTHIPDIYCEKGTEFMCNQCLKQASGHADCMREGCQICQIVGRELTRRLLLEKSFREGSLILEETISKQPEETSAGFSESVLSRYILHFQATKT